MHSNASVINILKKKGTANHAASYLRELVLAVPAGNPTPVASDQSLHRSF